MFDATTTQKNLNAHGFGLAVDGHLGPATFAALLAQAALSRRTDVRLAQAQAASGQVGSAGIDTPLRLRHFLTQAACETAGFTKLVESDGGDPNYFNRYEGNRGLGNTEPGDGARFRGRGWLDTTGRWNYTHLAGIVHINCVANPELLEDPHYAVMAACAFWNEKGCNAFADVSDIRSITLRINGGYNGLADRMTYFERLSVIQP